MVPSQFSRRTFVGMSFVGLLTPSSHSRADSPDVPRIPEPDPAPTETIEGNVIYRERMMLPQGARVEVKLLDVSRADAPSVTIASVDIADANASPIPYRLSYDPRLIGARDRLALHARIVEDDRLLFTSTSHHPALSEDQTTTDIVVERVSSPTDTELGLYGAWLAEDIEGGGVIDRAQTTLEIAQDGSVSGSGGCNRYAGNATVDGNKIAFGALVSTERACVEALMNQEHKFHQALARVVSFEIDSPRRKLTLLGRNGERLVVFAAN